MRPIIILLFLLLSCISSNAQLSIVAGGSFQKMNTKAGSNHDLYNYHIYSKGETGLFVMADYKIINEDENSGFILSLGWQKFTTSYFRQYTNQKFGEMDALYGVAGAGFFTRLSFLELGAQLTYNRSYRVAYKDFVGIMPSISLGSSAISLYASYNAGLHKLSEHGFGRSKSTLILVGLKHTVNFKKRLRVHL